MWQFIIYRSWQESQKNCREERQKNKEGRKFTVERSQTDEEVIWKMNEECLPPPETQNIFLAAWCNIGSPVVDNWICDLSNCYWDWRQGFLKTQLKVKWKSYGLPNLGFQCYCWPSPPSHLPVTASKISAF